MLTAPNPHAQAELLVEAYEKGQIDPATVGYIECHGTGTSLGDPIEIRALAKSFQELYAKHNKAIPETPHIGLSSVKTKMQTKQEQISSDHPGDSQGTTVDKTPRELPSLAFLATTQVTRAIWLAAQSPRHWP